jgi:hypothetical protein
MFRRTVLEYLTLNDAAPVFASRVVKSEALTLLDSVVHGSWQIYRLLSEGLRLDDSFSTDLYGPFYGTLTLQQLLSTLTLAQLRAILTLSEEP